MLKKEAEAVLLNTSEELNKIIKGDGHCQQAMTAVYITEDAQIAGELSARKLPCLYIEAPGKEQRMVSGIPYIWQGELDHGIGQAGNYGLDAEFLLRIRQRCCHLPWTIAETERLQIRESVMEDLPDLLVLYKEERENPDVTPFSEEPEEELRAYIKNRYPFYGYGLWSVADKETGRVIGRAGLEEGSFGIELSYLIGRKWRGQGYAREAAQAILTCAKDETGAEEIWLRTSPGNRASAALARGLGFEACGQKEGKNVFMKIP